MLDTAMICMQQEKEIKMVIQVQVKNLISNKRLINLTIIKERYHIRRVLRRVFRIMKSEERVGRQGTRIVRRERITHR